MRLDARLAGIGAVLVAIAALAALVAPWLAPFDPAEQFDPAYARQLPPLSERVAVRLATDRWLLAESATVEGSDVLLIRDGVRRRLPAEEIAVVDTGPQITTLSFFLGTDQLGRDVWSRLLHASRASMLVALLAVTLALTLGIAVGSLAALAGGWVDAALMRSVDGILALPRLFLILLITSLTRPDPALMILILGATSWMGISRLTRAQLLGLKGGDLEAAALATGRHPFAVYIRHLLPNALTPLVVDVTLRIGDLILVEAALSYLGLGIQPPAPSWGNMIADGGVFLRTSWWIATPAALATTLTVTGFNLLGDGLRDHLDPRTLERA